ncbi:MAG TPA: aminotransferase class V-fold PLP-dependent enzyme [Acidimicrobiales bacterium]|nr:aminotransferase class V-fold PLP-dependent enzyme [Acidimicrobiales bacterium]
MPTRAYLDHASASPLRPEARAAVLAWLDAADPGRMHIEGRMARAALEAARESVAGLLGAAPRSVVFTSGGTEALNAAVVGAVARARQRGVERPEVVVPAVEWSSVAAAAARVATVVPVGVDGDGAVDPAALAAAVTPATALVNCQWANHEVGTVQPVREVVEACRDRGVPVHVDACAAAGHLPIAFDALGADLLSVSAAKMGGPHGAGALLVRRGLRVPPLLLGGAQERDRRAGLEDVAGQAGFGAAAEVLAASLEAEAAAARERVGRLRAAALAVPGVHALGPASPGGRLPHLLCLLVDGVEAEAVLLGLDQAGVAAHSGSACSSETLEPSPVLEAMGVAAERSLRLSVGWSTTDADIELACAAFPAVVGRLRALAGSGGA